MESWKIWFAFLRNVYGVELSEQSISFKEQMQLDHAIFIDGYVPETKVLIEQKGLGKDLNKPNRQSDGFLLIPIQ